MTSSETSTRRGEAAQAISGAVVRLMGDHTGRGAQVAAGAPGEAGDAGG